MAPYFESVKSFADIPLTDMGVPTAEFLEASDGLVGMFDLLGVGVFSFVQSDIKSNIHGVRTTFKAKPLDRHTLEMLVKSEATDHHKHGTGCLRRLLRGLLFTCRALQESRANPHEEKLQPSFSRAYDVVLRRHHGFAVRTVVQVALRACPYRRDFYSRIAQGGSQEKLDEELARWLAGLDAIVQRMAKFYESGGHGSI
ncbi:glycolipid transfer protein [Fomitiporia mediterranea MF3/22]|uniref:glycolipid transfer protein n=1 Tax=Fomitiporia mediterranea (strain MF3/22) TaxID=694068 RepID=UPI0004407C63|nr:glycolipid transfer protein [Fomitiporia mediterranea MF3/22]EJC99681.1 glycolipid transfer protein [Fomitiporia mediterranea MF3/22]